MRFAGLLTVVGLVGAAPAEADTKVLRFTRSTPLPSSWQQLPDRLVKSIASAVDAKIAEESLIELQCDATPMCLDDIAKQLDATEIIFGTIRAGVDRDHKLVTITRFAPGLGRAQETFTIKLVGDEAPRTLV